MPRQLVPFPHQKGGLSSEAFYQEAEQLYGHLLPDNPRLLLNEVLHILHQKDGKKDLKNLIHFLESLSNQEVKTNFYDSIEKPKQEEFNLFNSEPEKKEEPQQGIFNMFNSEPEKKEEEKKEKFQIMSY